MDLSQMGQGLEKLGLEILRGGQDVNFLLCQGEFLEKFPSHFLFRRNLVPGGIECEKRG